jgi:hypothetical protein
MGSAPKPNHILGFRVKFTSQTNFAPFPQRYFFPLHIHHLLRIPQADKSAIETVIPQIKLLMPVLNAGVPPGRIAIIHNQVTGGIAPQ